MLTLDPNLKLFDICYCAALEVPRSAFLLLFVSYFSIYVPCIVFCSFYFYFNFFIIFLLCLEHNTLSQCGRYFFFYPLMRFQAQKFACSFTLNIFFDGIINLKLCNFTLRFLEHNCHHFREQLLEESARWKEVASRRLVFVPPTPAHRRLYRMTYAIYFFTARIHKSPIKITYFNQRIETLTRTSALLSNQCQIFA